MKKRLRYSLVVLSVFFAIIKNGSAQISYTWTGATSGNWNTSTNWSPAGIPGSPDNVTIVTGSNNCILAGNTTVNNVTMNSGTLNVGAFTFSVAGNASFLAGTISGTGVLSCSGNSTVFGTTAGGPTVAPAVTINTLSIVMTRSTFGSTVDITKMPAATAVDSWRGGNTFNGYFKMVNASADTTGDRGDIWFSSNATDPTDVFNNRADFYVTGCARIRIPHSGKATFNGVTRFYSQGYGAQHDRIQPARFNHAVVTFNDSVYLYCTSTTTDVQVAYEAGSTAIFNGPLVAVHYGPSAAEFSLGNDGVVQFNNNVVLNNNGTGSISMTRGTGSSTLASGKTISVGALGFNSGSLNIYNFTQLGTAPQSLTLLNTSALTVGSSTGACVFNGAVNYTAPSLTVVNTRFNNDATFTKTGNSNNSWGGNTFTQPLTITHTSASGTLSLSATMAADNFMSALDLVVTGGGTTKGSRAFATTYNDITVSCTGAGGAIIFGDNGFASTLPAGKTITVGSSGFTNGGLYLYLFNQTGTTPQSILMTGTLAKLRLGSQTAATQGCNFGGDFTGTAGFIELCGNTFNRTSTFTQSGASGTPRTWGGNTYTGAHSLTVTGTCGIQCSQLLAADTYLSTVNASLSSTGTGGITLARTFNTTFNDNITLSNTSTGTVAFGFNGGISTLVGGKTISVGGAGFSSGNLWLYYFNQLGGTPQSILCTGPSILQYGPASTFNGNVISTSGGLLFNGCTYNGTATCTKTGGGNDLSTGNNFFNGVAIISNNGTGSLTLGSGNHDEFNSTATFNNTGSSHLNVAYNSAGNIFNDVVTFYNAPSATAGYITVAYGTVNNTTFNENVLINNVNGNGIYFGYNAAAGTPAGTGTTLLASGKTITVGPSGFNTGTLRLRNFTQAGTTPQNLVLTNTATVEYGPASTFNGNVLSTSPGLLLQGCTFNGTLDCTKSGASNDASSGNNIFNGTTLIMHSGTGYERLAGTNADDYNADVTFTQMSTGALLPAYGSNCTFAGNITINTPTGTAMTFASAAAGVVTMDGSAAQTINRPTGNVPLLNRLTINKTGGDVTLNTRINIGVMFTPTSGIMNTTSGNILNMNAGSTTTVGNTSSYINGPMNYDVSSSGVRTLNFPIGKASDWRPAAVAINHSTGTSYTYNAEVFNASAMALGYTMPVTVDTVSFMHYWDIHRYTTGTTTSAPSANLSGNQTITLYFGANDGVRDGANLTICKNTSTALTSWIDIGGSGAPAYAGGVNLSGSLSSTSSPSAFNSFSRFTLGSKTIGWNPLPIELLSFTATPQEEHVDLKWITATETNNDHYEIERSADGSTFEYVGRVGAHGNGNSTCMQTYNSRDEQPYGNTSYYRLKQVDRNGNFTYSAIVAVTFNKQATISFYPNPASDIVHISASDNCPDASINITDATGRAVRSWSPVQSLNGAIDVSYLSAGIYTITIRSGQELKMTRLVIQR